MYLERHLYTRLNAYLRQFPCILLLGARQTGKTTFLQHALPAWQRIDLESPAQKNLLASDLDLFLQDHPERVWFDEAQQVPELFAALRSAIDQDRRPGRYVLSGSASPSLVRGVSESLAGRVGILHIGPLSATEQTGRPPSRFLEELFQARDARSLFERLSGDPPIPRTNLLRLWLRGGYPEPALTADPVKAWRWFDSYIRTLSERDLSSVARGLSPPALDRLLRMLAARHGQCLNLSDFARDLGIAPRTAHAYLDLLESSFLYRRLPPYLTNIGKRLVKTPRSFLVDSGLLHHLLQIHDQESLAVHPVLGASWEGWIGEQLIRRTELMEPAPALFHWRTQAGAEVDLIFEIRGGRLFPVEIKHAVRLDGFAVRGLRRFLDDFADRASLGVVVYRGPALVRMTERILLVPAETAVL